jgi:hypothetical protein
VELKAIQTKKMACIWKLPIMPEEEDLQMKEVMPLSTLKVARYDVLSILECTFFLEHTTAELHQNGCN